MHEMRGIHSLIKDGEILLQWHLHVVIDDGQKDMLVWMLHTHVGATHSTKLHRKALSMPKVLWPQSFVWIWTSHAVVVSVVYAALPSSGSS